MEGYLVRYNGQWKVIKPKKYEPERMTTDVAWIQIKEGISAEEAYRKWFEQHRTISHLLQ